jgi:hypothetical protein
MKMLGGILIGAGILLAGLSGLCSLAILFGSGEFTGFQMWPAVLMFGGIPFAGGAGMIWGGRSMLRRARREREAADRDVSKIFE